MNTDIQTQTRHARRNVVAIALKIVAVILVLPSIVILSLSLVHGFDRDLLWLQLALATVVMQCAMLFFRCHNVGARTIGLSSLAGATVLGVIGFITGYWNPEWFGAHDNLAPLMGLFLTGPVGFIAGALVGVALGACVRPAAEPRSQSVCLGMKTVKNEP